MSAYSQVDRSGSYLANVILINGRNEVQIYPISQHASSLVVENLVKKYELDTDHKVVCVSWFNDIKSAESSRKQKRRASDSIPNGNGHSSTAQTAESMLAVCLENGNILVFSPFGDSAANTITGIEKSVSVTCSSGSNTFWALSESAAVSEVNAESGAVEKSFKFGAVDANVRKLEYTDFKPKKGLGMSLLLASSVIYIADGARSKKQLVAELAHGASDKNETSSTQNIACILPVAQNVIAAIREGSNVIYFHDLATPNESPVSLEIRTGRLEKVVFLDGKTGLAFGSTGVEVVQYQNGAAESRGVIQTNHAEITFENAFTSDNGVIGVWYDGNQPRFVKIADNLEELGDISVDINYTPRTADATVSTAEVSFLAGDLETIHNIGADNLFAELSTLLRSEKVSKKAVIRLCSSNDSEEDVKDTMRQFSVSPDCSVLVERLFLVISHRVAADPSKKSSLSIWLKWVLLVHGGYISKQEKLNENLRELQRSLDDGMKIMPRLLALQGRLQLLKSQAELRERISQNADNDDSEVSDGDTFNDTFNTTNIEESVVYANGENDDFDSIGADNSAE